jgi:hypothetical protein
MQGKLNNSRRKCNLYVLIDSLSLQDLDILIRAKSENIAMSSVFELELVFLSVQKFAVLLMFLGRNPSFSSCSFFDLPTPHYI